ncbi:MAG: flagellar M-ring protein FliF [Sedimentisphaerales bacterium]|nr:flagellar M-ring protein FliF [Sedimentisphaerales bacterium]
MGLLQKINAVWQKVGVVQKAMLIAIVLACAITGGLLTKWASSADMRLMYSELSTEDAGKIVDKISELNVPYELRGNGTSIYVPEKQVYQLRLAMAKEGLPANHGSGINILDDRSIAQPPAIMEYMLDEAKQKELANTIQMIEGVIGARVHIARPEHKGIIATKTDETKATVMLVVQPGWTITQSNAAAIAHIVAGATPSLLAENVTIMDSQGRLLSSKGATNQDIGDADSYHALKRNIESKMNDQIRQSLEMVLGPGRVSVISSVTLNMDSQSVVKTLYEKGIPEQETIDKTTNTKDAVTDDKGNITAAGNNELVQTITTVMKVPSTTETLTKISGEPKAWSITAIVDLTRPIVENPEATTEETNTPATTAAAATATATSNLIMTIEDVEEIIINAIGGRNMLADENALTVKNVPIYQTPMIAMGQTGNYEKIARIINIVRHSSMGILAVCALFVLRIFTKASKKVRLEEPMVPSGQLGMGGGIGLLPAAADSADAYRQHIAGELRANPDQVRKLFASWLTEAS